MHICFLFYLRLSEPVPQNATHCSGFIRVQMHFAGLYQAYTSYNKNYSSGYQDQGKRYEQAARGGLINITVLAGVVIGEITDRITVEKHKNAADEHQDTKYNVGIRSIMHRSPGLL
jgi:hypothetical protein